jgi:chemotaxis protein methyltransferase CheR
MGAMIPEALLAQLSRCLDQEIGLHFPKTRWPDLQRGMRSVASELGFKTIAECAESLVSKRLTKSQLELLAAHLTIGETYFFRDLAVFAFLETRVLPELIQARRSTGRQLRIWSAGCCTGEEVYSLAIALRRLLPDIADWQVTLLGTDVNPQFLKKASEGCYTNWSFRGSPDSVRKESFQRMTDGSYQIVPAIKDLVTFGALNLAEDVYPSLLNDTNAMDVIFCRNVLMYFSTEQVGRVARKLYQCLVNGGWLFTSPTEVSSNLFPQFATVRTEGVIAYRRQEIPSAPAPSFAAPPKKAPARPVKPHRPAKATVVMEAPAIEPDQTTLDLARRLANEGRLSDALAECDKVILGNKLIAPGHYLRGMILQEKGAFAEAREALRRALFLDHDFVVAHFALGNLTRQQGRPRDAARSLATARTLLQKYAPEAELPEADGVTAGRLLALIETIQEIWI